MTNGDDDYRPTVVVDFDGVLNTYSGWQGPAELFEPRPHAKEFLELLVDSDYEVRVHSTRQAWRIQEWLLEHGLDLDGAVRAVDEKPPAIAYVDDRGVAFQGDYDEAFRRITDLDAWGPHWQSLPPKQAADETERQP